MHACSGQSYNIELLEKEYNAAQNLNKQETLSTVVACAQSDVATHDVRRHPHFPIHKHSNSIPVRLV